jgi:hypothetical protein
VAFSNEIVLWTSTMATLIALVASAFVLAARTLRAAFEMMSGSLCSAGGSSGERSRRALAYVSRASARHLKSSFGQTAIESCAWVVAFWTAAAGSEGASD